MSGPTTVQERIVIAAIACIERDGLEATGIREIAREAGVNSAAINYYFRSKENLIAVALERSLEEGFQGVVRDFDERVAAGASAREALRQVLDEYLLHATLYPRIAYAHLREALVHQRYDVPAVRQLNDMLAQLLERLKPALPHKSEQALRMSLSHVWATLMMTGLLPGLFSSFHAWSPEDAVQRGAFVAQLMADVFDV